MAKTPARRGEDHSPEYCAWVRSVLDRAFAATGVLSDFQARFIADFDQRFARYGARTAISVKQHNVLHDIDGKLRREGL